MVGSVVFRGGGAGRLVLFLKEGGVVGRAPGGGGRWRPPSGYAYVLITIRMTFIQD